MDFLLNAGSIIISYGPPFLFVLTIVVFFHELGHFLVARWCGVGVTTFSIGFGPELFGWNDRKGTRWRVAIIPLGGYVKFVGDEDAASTPDFEAQRKMSDEERARSFPSKPVAQRAAVVAAGPIANFLLAIVIFACVFMFLGRATLPAVVGEVRPDTAAAEAGLQAGDVILAINGREMDTFADVQRMVMNKAEVPLDVTIRRGEALLDKVITPRLHVEQTRFGVQRRGLLGVQARSSPEDVVIKTYAPHEAVIEGTKETWFVIARTTEYIARVITGSEPADQLGGPLRVAQISGEVADVGWSALINLTAVLSISIGIINLLPIPMLDGGHLVFYAIEAVRGRPLSERAQELGFRFGLAIVLMLFVFATFNDLRHFASL